MISPHRTRRYRRGLSLRCYGTQRSFKRGLRCVLRASARSVGRGCVRAFLRGSRACRRPLTTGRRGRAQKQEGLLLRLRRFPKTLPRPSLYLVSVGGWTLWVDRSHLGLRLACHQHSVSFLEALMSLLVRESRRETKKMTETSSRPMRPRSCLPTIHKIANGSNLPYLIPLIATESR